MKTGLKKFIKVDSIRSIFTIFAFDLKKALICFFEI